MAFADLVELLLHSCVMRTMYHCLDVLSLDLQGFSSLTQNRALGVEKPGVAGMLGCSSELVSCWL